MKLQPKYNGGPRLSIEIPLRDPSIPLIRQRRRLADLLRALQPEQWEAQSRCAEWTVRDVVSHLNVTNRFWAYSIKSGRDGSPTELLANFNPVVTPALLVDATRTVSVEEVLADYLESIREIEESLEGVQASTWRTVTAEAPIGHVELQSVALHALWDSWIHERDISIPLGLELLEDDEEIMGILYYISLLCSVLSNDYEEKSAIKIFINAKSPSIQFILECADPAIVRIPDERDNDLASLEGSSVDLIERLSARVPIDGVLDKDVRKMAEGISKAFEP